VLIVLGTLQHGRVVVGRGGQDGGFKNKMRRCRDALGQVMGHSGIKTG